ncbi:MAG: FecR domain-containing protein [Maricaulaceae bacterium]|jgi:transmembrane sensor
MTTDDQPSSASDVTSEACAWIAQLETGELTEQDLAAFREWVERSPRHFAEVRRLARLSGDINVLSEMSGPLREAADRRRPLLRSRSGTAAPVLRGVVAAAVAAFAVIAVVMFATQRAQLGAERPYMIATAVGELQEAALSDGSNVNLSTDSLIEVDFDRTQRRVRLLQGEAYFDVAHNPDRPFVVYAGDMYVTAVGTAFAVRLTNDDLVVTVSEGRVSLDEAPSDIGSPAQNSEASASRPAAEASSPPAPRAFLDAGQQIKISSGAEDLAVRDISERELTRAMSWRTGYLEFDGTPLGDVAQEMGRYNGIDIEIADDALRTQTFGGIFRIGETEALFDALELSFDVEVIHVSDDHVLLRRAPS